MVDLGLTLLRRLLQQQVHMVDHATLDPLGLGVVLAHDRAVGDRVDDLGSGHQLIQRALGVEQRRRYRGGVVGGSDTGDSKADDGQRAEHGGGAAQEIRSSHEATI